MDFADPLAPFAGFGPAKAVKLSRTQKVVAARMADNRATIPHATRKR